jgi:pimeloyl-ACP methyl ester carboxylesterase
VKAKGEDALPYSTHQGVRTYYEVAGAGPAMVLVHANPFDHNLFLYQIQHFSTWFKVIATDMRGYGRSDVVTKPYTLADMAGDVFAVCKQEGVTSAVVGGVSTGSGIALLMGLDRPDFCKAVILVGGGSGSPCTAEELKQPTERMADYLSLGMGDGHIKHLTELVAPDFAKSKLGAHILNMFVEKGQRFGWTAEGICEVLRARRGTDMTPRLKSMKVPTLVINGEYDNSMKGGTATAKGVPGAVHKVLPKTGHACNIEDPATFDGFVIDFLTERGLMPALGPADPR